MVMWHMGDGWGWWMGFGSIWMVGFWAVVIWAVYTLSKRRSGDHHQAATDAGTAQEILERRYARGELSDEQYEAMRTRLSRPVAPMAAAASAPDRGGPEAASSPTARAGSHPATVRS
jgi:putative membrane protein